jgi:hypothetical protein
VCVTFCVRARAARGARARACEREKESQNQSQSQSRTQRVRGTEERESAGLFTGRPIFVNSNFGVSLFFLIPFHGLTQIRNDGRDCARRVRKASSSVRQDSRKRGLAR